MTKLFYAPRLSSSRERGFTLVELALVLMVASLITGVIWVAAETVWEDYRASRAAQQITSITQNIRSYYVALQNITAGEITSQLDKANLFPFEMRRNPSAGPGRTPIDNPFNSKIVSGAAPANGSLHVTGLTCSNNTPLTNTCFRIRVLGLEPGTCIKLLQAIPVTDGDLGIVAVGTQNAVPLPDSATTMTGLKGVPNAVNPSTAEGWCNQAGANNEVDWDFKLHN